MDLDEKKIIFIKWFSGPPKTGGEEVFINFYQATKTKYRVFLIDSSPFKIGREKRLLYFLFVKPIEIFVRNRLSIRFVKQGYEVYSWSHAGTIEIIQPPPSHTKIQRIFGAYYRFFDRLSRFGSDNLKIVIYVSQFTMNNYKIRKKNIIEFVVHPGIEFSANSVSFDEKENIIVTVSRIVPEKNLERLCRILENIGYQHFLIGFSFDDKYVKKLVKLLPKTNFIINATQEKKISVLKKAKVFLMTSEGEAFGLVLLESLAYGVAPVVPRSGGPTEYLEDSFLYDTDKEAEEKVLNLMRNYNSEMFRKLTAKYKENFTMEKFQKNILMCLDKSFNMYK